jgi:hypothetical protein
MGKEEGGREDSWWALQWPTPSQLDMGISGTSFLLAWTLWWRVVGFSWTNSYAFLLRSCLAACWWLFWT